MSDSQGDAPQTEPLADSAAAAPSTVDATAHLHGLLNRALSECVRHAVPRRLSQISPSAAPLTCTAPG